MDTDLTTRYDMYRQLLSDKTLELIDEVSEQVDLEEIFKTRYQAHIAEFDSFEAFYQRHGDDMVTLFVQEYETAIRGNSRMGQLGELMRSNTELEVEYVMARNQMDDDGIADYVLEFIRPSILEVVTVSLSSFVTDALVGSLVEVDDEGEVSFPLDPDQDAPEILRQAQRLIEIMAPSKGPSQAELSPDFLAAPTEDAPDLEQLLQGAGNILSLLAPSLQGEGEDGQANPFGNPEQLLQMASNFLQFLPDMSDEDGEEEEEEEDEDIEDLEDLEYALTTLKQEGADDPDLRCDMVEILAEFDHPQARETLCQLLLEDEDAAVRELSARGLAGVLTKETFMAQQKAIQGDEDEYVRLQLVRNLGRLVALQEAAQGIIEDVITNDPSPGVRYFAAESLKISQDDQVDPA